MSPLPAWRRWLGVAPSTSCGERLYGQLVALARAPVFFARWDVPDTLDGRFETICLHVALVMRRLRRDGEATRNLQQELGEAMIADMDRSLRELGVGDLGVGKRVRAMGEAMMGRTRAYDAALEEGAEPDALAASLRRNLYGTRPETTPAAVLAVAGYARQVDAVLAAHPTAMLFDGVLPVIQADGCHGS